MSILVAIGNMTRKIHSHLIGISILVSCVFAIALLWDINGGFLSAMPRRTVGGMGKMAGSVALVIGAMTCLYYALRESYIQLKRRNISMSVEVENGMKQGIGIFRHIHAICGMLAFLLIVGHGYMLWYVVGKNKALEIDSGLFALLVLGVLALTGGYIVSHPKRVQVRKYHRILTAILVISVVIHLMLI